MRIFLSVVIILLMSVNIFAEENTLSKEEKEAGWKLLFDGKTLEGWNSWKTKAAVETGKWKVEDGTLMLNGKGGGDVYTAEAFENFEMELEWKTTGNSGILLRVNPKVGSKIWHCAPEMQVNKDDPESLKSTSSGGLYALYDFKDKKVYHPDGWNKVKIQCVDDQFVIWFNGKKEHEFTVGSDDWNRRVAKSKFKNKAFAKLKKGHFGLQDHGKKVQYRNIKLREMKSKK